VKDFRDLKVWEKSHQVTLSVYKVRAAFPREETYGLTSQIRRCCVSVSANIAEGCGRGSDAEFAQFLQIAMGSASELEYCLLLARELNFVGEDSYTPLAADVTEVKRMLATLIQKLRADR